MIKVALVYKVGGDFAGADVVRLTASIRKHLTIPHEIICLTDSEIKGSLFADKVIKLKHNWPGWWSKLELFALEGPLLYFDLDTVIIDNINKLAESIFNLRSNFIILRDFYKPETMNSSIMGWRYNARFVYDGFLEYLTVHNFIKRGDLISLPDYRGDQDFIFAAIENKQNSGPGFWWQGIQDEFPGIRSYKIDVRYRQVPAGTNVICFHGKPRPNTEILKGLGLV